MPLGFILQSTYRIESGRPVVLVYGALEGLNALVVGAGETGRLVAQHLRKAGIAKMLLASRTIGRAQQVASEVDAEPAVLSGLPAALRHADVVVTSTASEVPISTDR